MPPKELPYDMGNAGDLVKHGLLGEFVRWWCEQESGTLRYLDPFAGPPWVSPPSPEVTRRVQSLPRCAIRDAQPRPDERYYGSSFVVPNAAKAYGSSAKVWVSDSDPEARDLFRACRPPIEEIKTPRFSPSDGFSILDCQVDADLLLLDPFGEFLKERANSEIPKIADVSSRLACVLFVLNLDPSNRVGLQYRSLRSKHLPNAWSLHCPKLPGTPVRGEATYEVEVLLAWQRLVGHPGRDILKNRIKAYARSLSEVLNAEIKFSDAG